MRPHLWSCVLRAALLLCAVAVPARATELHVDPLLGSDATGNGSPAAPFRSLTRALQVAQGGDTVRGHAGIYSPVSGEQFPLLLKSGVAVVGAGRGQAFLIGLPSAVAVRADQTLSATTVLQGFTLRSFDTGIEVLSTGAQARLLDLRLEGGRLGVRIAAVGAGTLAPRLERCLFLGPSAHGVRIEGVAAATVRPVLVNCVFQLAGASGLVLIPQVPGSVLQPVVSYSTFCRNGTRAVEVRGGSGAALPEVYNSILVGQTVDLDAIDPIHTGNNLLGASLLLGVRGNYAGDPRFVDEAGGDLHVGQGSAVLDRADPALPETPTLDLDGQTRGGARDVGADERVEGTLYVRDDGGAHPGLPLWCRHVDVPGRYVTIFLSYGVLSPGFPVPGLRGELQLDVGLLLLPMFFGQVAATGYVDGPIHIPNDSAIAGLTVFLQSVGVGYAPALSGGWSDVLTPTILGQ